jgi:tetratricopeptide (TPR) repeat protein
MGRPATKSDPDPTMVSSGVRTRPNLPVWLIGVLLGLVTLALYWPATRCNFVNYDDDFYVTSNAHVQNGLTWAGMKWAWANSVAGNWHPVTVLSHMLDCQLFGLNSGGHHLTNVLLHALNAGLVFWLLQRMTGARWRSLWVAALFAVHPLRVESVAWVSERKDVLSGCFGLLTLMAYALYAQRRMQNSEFRMQNLATRNTQHATRNTQHVSRFTFQARTFYFLSLFLFALGLMSKPMLVTWPFLMLLLDYWPLRRMPNAECRMQNAAASDTQHATRNTAHVPRTALLPLLFEKTPFFVLAAAVSVVTFLVQQRAGAVMMVESLSLSARVGNALISYGRYLGKLFWPTNLAVYYPRPGQWPMGKVLLAGGLVLGLSVWVWARRRRHPYSLMGWLWFLGTLVPVIGLVQAGGQAMADRYTYLPSLGVLVLAVWGAYELTRSWRYQVPAWSVAGGAAIVLCLALTHQQLGYWKDGETLFRHALEVTENNQIAYKVLGDALDKKGQPDEAINQFREAIRLRPGYADAHDNLGVALAKKGQTDEALRQFQEAIRPNPGYVEAHYNLGIILSRKGQMDEAIGQFQEAIRLKPDYAEAHNDLGIALGRKGQIDQALGEFQEATHLKPGYAEAHFNLGLVLSLRGQTPEAIRHFEAALKAKPDYPEAHNYLGSAWYQQGRTVEAIREFQEALKLKPDYVEARKNLNVVLAAKTDAAKQPGASTNH